MSTLAWWLIPLGATVLALVWAAWRSRPRRPADAHEAMEGMQRFKAAMERPLPARPGRSRRPEAGHPDLPRDDTAKNTAA